MSTLFTLSRTPRRRNRNAWQCPILLVFSLLCCGMNIAWCLGHTQRLPLHHRLHTRRRALATELQRKSANAAEECVVDENMALVCNDRVITPLEFLDQDGVVDPYQVLGVKFLASEAKIREAYLKVCKVHHPDLHGGEESYEWQMASRAYQILRDPQQRSKYDVRRATRSIFDLAGNLFKVGFAVAQAVATVTVAAVEAVKISISGSSGLPETSSVPASPVSEEATLLDGETHAVREPAGSATTETAARMEVPVEKYDK